MMEFYPKDNGKPVEGLWLGGSGSDRGFEKLILNGKHKLRRKIKNQLRVL